MKVSTLTPGLGMLAGRKRAGRVCTLEPYLGHPHEVATPRTPPHQDAKDATSSRRQGRHLIKDAKRWRRQGGVLAQAPGGFMSLPDGIIKGSRPLGSAG
jgi:hypothetical protein